jgi:hypothetical protein
MDWVYDDTPPEDDVEKYIYLKAKDKTLSTNAGRVFSLYRFVKSRNFKSPDELRNSIFLDKQKKNPVFSETQSKALFKLIKKQKGGNDTGQIINDKGALDNLIQGIINEIKKFLPANFEGTINSVSPFVFAAETLEDEIPVVGFALDYIVLALDLSIKGIQLGVPLVAQVLPIPYAGPIGQVIGWGLSGIFVFLLVAVNISRGDFGEAFINLYLLIPFVGFALNNAASKGDQFATKSTKNIVKILESLRGLPGGATIATFLEGLIPGTVLNPAQPEAPPRQKRTVAELTEQARTLGQTAKAKLGNRLAQAKTFAQSARDKVTAKMGQSPALPPEVSTTNEDPQPAAAAAGGKRFSTRKHNSRKWPKTMRRRKSRTH